MTRLSDRPRSTDSLLPGHPATSPTLPALVWLGDEPASNPFDTCLHGEIQPLAPAPEIRHFLIPPQ
jgi:hypothetical protein